MEKKLWLEIISILFIDVKQKLITRNFLFASLLMAGGSYLGTVGYGMDSCFDLFVTTLPAMSDFAVFNLTITAFIASRSFCQDYHSGVFSFKLLREGIHRYTFSQTTSCILSSVMITILARIWFLVLLLLNGHPLSLTKFELENNLSPNVFYYDRCMEQGNILGAFLVVIFSAFLLNSICALAGLAFSSWFMNPYVAWFVPYIFLLMYKILFYHVKQEYRLDFIGQAGSVSHNVFINIIYAASIATLHGLVLILIFYYGIKRRVNYGQLKE